MREQDINGRWINNAIGFCHYEKHRGALNKQLAQKHKCRTKHCRYLEKYDDDVWRPKDKYRNRRKNDGEI